MSATFDRPETEAAARQEAERPSLRVVAERAAPSPRDWSNVAFSPAFCEEARRAWEGRKAS